VSKCHNHTDSYTVNIRGNADLTLESSAKLVRPTMARFNDLILENTVKIRSQDLKSAFIFHLEIAKLFVRSLC